MPNTEIINGFEYTVEQVPNKPQWFRPKMVHGPLVRKRNKSQRDGKVKPLCYETGGEVPAGYDRGHIIALGLGGADHPKNLVPMMSYFNRQTYKEVETLLKLELSKQQMVYVGIMIDYYSATPVVPEKFTIHRHHGDATRPEEPIVLRQFAQPREKYTIPNGIYDCLVKNQATYRTDYLNNDPNAKLTYFFFDIYGGPLGLSGISDIAPGKFSKLQRDCVWSLNCFNNNASAQTGWLVSDATDDPHRNLNPKGLLDFPEVDHITPFSRSGTNSFLNAQLTSAYYNRSKSADNSGGGGDKAPSRESKRMKKVVVSYKD